MWKLSLSDFPHKIFALNFSGSGVLILCDSITKNQSVSGDLVCRNSRQALQSVVPCKTASAFFVPILLIISFAGLSH
jgi:hypothetical protein